MPPILGKLLILYILATTTCLGALLAQHDENGKEQAIYYVNRTLALYEVNYINIEIYFLTITFSSQNI